ncbi:dockerin type I repeat-containing protein [Ruminiclostridium josui]|nr:dockerin type I repeat-containing protein [Ruminiclostridium josui]
MGSVCTWYTFINCLDYIKYFIPLSGDCWALGSTAGSSKPAETAQYLADVVSKSGYKAPQDFKLFCATGSEDIAYPNMRPQIEAMKKYTNTFIYSSDIKNGNFYFMVANGGTHWWGYINQYIYNILPDLFQDVAEPVQILGDLNGDGSVDATDYALLKMHILNTTPLTGDALKNADVDKNGEVNALDFAVMKKYLLGVITTF